MSDVELFKSFIFSTHLFRGKMFHHNYETGNLCSRFESIFSITKNIEVVMHLSGLPHLYTQANRTNLGPEVICILYVVLFLHQPDRTC